MPVDINGEIISDEKAGVSPFDSGFQYGFGLYETFFVKDSKVAFYPEHISRLKSSLKYFNLEVPYDFFERLRARILLLIHENSISDGRLRMTLTPGIWRLPLFRTEKINSVLNIQPISKQPDSVSLQISRVLKSPVPVFPPFVKITGNYPSILSYREARGAGFDEGLMITTENIITEGSFCNLFWVSGDGKIQTPSLDCPILDGVTRNKILEAAKLSGIGIEEGAFDVSLITSFRNVYISSSTRGLLNVSKIGKVEFNGHSEKRIDVIREKYESLLEESLKKF